MGYINMPELSKDVQDMINKGIEVKPADVDYTNYYKKAEILEMAEEINKRISAMLDSNMVYTKISIDNKIDKLRNEINKINSIDTYSKSDIDRIINKIRLDLANKLNAGDVYSKGEVEKLVDNAISKLGVNPDNYYTKEVIDQKLTNVLTKSDVENSLSSESTTKAISANQLRIINQNIELLKQSASDGHSRIISTMTSVTNELGDDHSFEKVCKVLKTRIKSHLPKGEIYVPVYIESLHKNLNHIIGDYIVLHGKNFYILSNIDEHHRSGIKITEYTNDGELINEYIFKGILMTGNIILKNKYVRQNIYRYCACSDNYIYILRNGVYYIDDEINVNSDSRSYRSDDSVLVVIDLNTMSVVKSVLIPNTKVSNSTNYTYNDIHIDSIAYCSDSCVILTNGIKINIPNMTIEKISRNDENNTKSVFYVINDNELVMINRFDNGDRTIGIEKYNFITRTLIETSIFDNSIINNLSGTNKFTIKGSHYLVGGICPIFIVDLVKMRTISLPTENFNMTTYTAYEAFDSLFVFAQDSHNDFVHVIIFNNGRIMHKKIDGIKPFEFMYGNKVGYYNNGVDGKCHFQFYELKCDEGSEYKEWNL